MGLISVKIVAAATETIIVGGTVVIFNGSQTIDNVKEKDQLVDFNNWIVNNDTTNTTTHEYSYLYTDPVNSPYYGRQGNSDTKAYHGNH